MPTYAARTEVSVGKSREELERILARWGATGFGYVSTPTQAAIEFLVRDRRVRFVLDMPNVNDREFLRTPTGLSRTEAAAGAAYHQAIRQRWRALLLVLKAKLEAVESGITEFDEEFLAHIVLDDGSTVYDVIKQDPTRLLNTSQLALGRGSD